MSRDRFFCALFALAAANGFANYVFSIIITDGFGSVTSLFGFSAIIWFAIIVASRLLYRGGALDAVTIPDIAVGLTVFLLTAVPFARFGWLALGVIGLYLLSIGPAGSTRRRAGFIALAITGPMLWAPILLDLFGAQILQADAILVSNLIGTDRVGNVYSAVTGTDRFEIYAGCSSLHGMSIAILGCVTISNLFETAWSLKYLICGVLAPASVLAINVTRLSLIGLFPSYYPMIHGSPGAEVASWLSITAAVGISLLGSV